MKKFWELLEASVIVQSLVTLMVITAMIVLWLVPIWGIQVEIQPEAYGMAGTILGFWFGVKVSYAKGQETKAKAKAFDQVAKRLGIDPDYD